MNITDRITSWAERTPLAVAIDSGRRIIHYRTFDRAVWRAAAWFRRQGVAPGDVVAVSLAAKSALYLVAVYGLARLGAVQIAIPARDAPALRQALARHFRVVAVLGDDAAAALDGATLLWPDPDWLQPGAAPIGPGLRHPGGDAPWLIDLSSGTTGAPKGVLRSHRDQHYIDERGRRDSGDVSGDRFLPLLHFRFVYELCNAMQVLDGGGVVRIPPPAMTREELFTLIDREAITRLVLTPSQAMDILAATTEDAPRFPRIRNLTLGTTIVPESLRRGLRRRVTPNVFIRYGCNEAWHLAVADARTQEAYPECVGRPYDGIEAEIVDEAGRALPPGEVGLVRFRGAGFPTEYIDNPEATANAFRDGWLYLGDLGSRTADGVLFLKGRADDVMNYDGAKIYPADIEITLMQHPAVLEAAAFPLPSPKYRDIPVAAVVLRTPIPVAELQAYCQERLGLHAPRGIAVLPSLPKSPIGKVLKRELAVTLTRQMAGQLGGA